MKVQINVLEVHPDDGTEGGEEKRYGLYDDIQEWGAETTGEVYRDARKEYGRCVSKMYRDTKDGGAEHIGWVFQKRVQYEDSNQTYIQEVWIMPVLNVVPRQVEPVIIKQGV